MGVGGLAISLYSNYDFVWYQLSMIPTDSFLQKNYSITASNLILILVDLGRMRLFLHILSLIHFNSTSSQAKAQHAYE